jgi:uncharacterized protein (DUF1778 family)
MSSKPSASSNVGAATPPASEEAHFIGARATQEQIYRIDRAALELGLRRSHFLVQAAIEKADQILASKGAVA